MALRIAVFVHEQGIVDEIELDGADLLLTTELFWMQNDDGEVTATLRVLADHDPVHIGRVATAAAARGRGYAGQLLRAALRAYPGAVEISAQSHLEKWYGRFGFARIGDDYQEAGIPHVRMLKTSGETDAT